MNGRTPAEDEQAFRALWRRIESMGRSLIATGEHQKHRRYLDEIEQAGERCFIDNAMLKDFRNIVLCERALLEKAEAKTASARMIGMREDFDRINVRAYSRRPAQRRP